MNESLFTKGVDAWWMDATEPDLSDEEQRSYFQFANATFTSYKPGRQVVLGVRGHF